MEEYTEGFSHLIGQVPSECQRRVFEYAFLQGGFGTVFKGKHHSGSAIAVKRLDVMNGTIDIDQFENEAPLCPSLCLLIRLSPRRNS